MSTILLDSVNFRLHVRESLCQYFKQHCSTDYLSFTEDLLIEFVDGLQPIPLIDPNSLIIPLQPFEVLSRIYSLQDLSSYDEKPQTTAESIEYIKTAGRLGSAALKTDRIVADDSYALWSPTEHMYQALTRRSRLDTKKLGKKKSEIFQTVKELVRVNKIEILEVEPVQDVVINVEDVLKLKNEIEADELPAVHALLGKAMETARSVKAPQSNTYLDPNFLCSETTKIPEHLMFDAPFTPVFPRSRRHGTSSATPAVSATLADYKSIAECPTAPLKPVEVVDPDGDISRQNLVVVDGWETIKSSPPSTPSHHSADEEDQLDDLSFPSSPNTTPPLVQEIENAKMDEIQIPRSRRVGGSSGISPHILHDKTLETFLLPLLCEPQTSDGPKKEAEVRISSPTPSSLVGQPPSALESSKRDDAEEFKDDNDVDADLRRIYEDNAVDKEFIMQETIDDAPNVYMNEPDLPQPNEFPKDLYIPKALSEFVIPPALKTENNHSSNHFVSLRSHQFLKTVKGCRSLALSLSWLAFTTEKKLPSELEILDVVDIIKTPSNPSKANSLPGSAVLSEEDYVKAIQLLDSVTYDDSSLLTGDVATRRGTQLEEGEMSYRPPSASEDIFHILLNRQERKRLARLEGRIHEYADLGDLDLVSELDEMHGAEDDSRRDDVFCDVSDADDDQRPYKRQKLALFVQDETLKDRRGDAPQLLENGGWDYHDQGCDSTVDMLYSEEDKENWPPSSSLFSPSRQNETANDSQWRLQGIDLADTQMGDEDDASFEPLSFGSRPFATKHVHRHGTSQGRLEDISDIVDLPPSAAIQRNAETVMVDATGPLAPPAVLELEHEPELASHALGIAAFALLRARRISEPLPVSTSDPAPIARETQPERRRGPPPEIFDSNTICLPDRAALPRSVHKYMASVDFIQKHGLVQALRFQQCLIELVERQSLAGVDLILDTSTAIMFLNLFSLPARCDAYVERVAAQSWKYGRLLIVFEAYTERSALKNRTTKQIGPGAVVSSDPYAFTPPIIKAIKKFRRDLNIAEACGTKRPEMTVQFAFADSVEEAASLTRIYGDNAEAADETQGAIWGERLWLDGDYLEDEEMNLAWLKGMNNFAASIILCQISLENFVNLSTEERIADFGGYIDPAAILACSDDLESRISALRTEQVLNGSSSELNYDMEKAYSA